jgi:hypothetical protein
MQNSELAERISNAVQHGLLARAEFYKSIDLPNEQELGQPASEGLVLALEAKLGHSLPPSYRTFLKLYNGWRMVDAETDLLSIEEMLTGPRAEKIKEWQQQAKKWGNELAASGLVIGHSNISQSRIILDPDNIDINSAGEWELIESYKDEEERYESFIVWLEKSVEDYRKIAEEPIDY